MFCIHIYVSIMYVFFYGTDDAMYAYLFHVSHSPMWHTYDPSFVNYFWKNISAVYFLCCLLFFLQVSYMCFIAILNIIRRNLHFILYDMAMLSLSFAQKHEILLIYNNCLLYRRKSVARNVWVTSWNKSCCSNSNITSNWYYFLYSIGVSTNITINIQSLCIKFLRQSSFWFLLFSIVTQFSEKLLLQCHPLCLWPVALPLLPEYRTTKDNLVIVYHICTCVKSLQTCNMFSIPFFNVTIELGHPEHEPCIFSWTIPSLKPLNMMSPPEKVIHIQSCSLVPSHERCHLPSSCTVGRIFESSNSLIINTVS